MDRTTPAPEPEDEGAAPLTPAGSTGPDESQLDPAKTASTTDDEDEERFDAG